MIIKNITTTLNDTVYRFGWGIKNELPAYAASLGTEVLLLTSRKHSGLHEVIEDFKTQAAELNLSVTHANNIESNPDINSLKEILDAATEHDVIIGLGGGSVLDAAKALAVFAANTAGIDELVKQAYLPDDVQRKKLILVPTTSGTGSELSHGAIISDRSENKKGGIRGKRLAPDIALVDPALTVTVPGHISAETGFDIFTHAFESYLSKKAHIHSRMLSLQVLSLVGDNLKKVLDEPGNRKLRTNLSYASSMIGLNLANVGTCLPHRLQYPIGGEAPQTSHPQGLGWIYPVWVKRVFPYASTDVVNAFNALGLKRPGDAGEASILIKNWLTEIGMETKPSVTLEPEHLAAKVAGNLKTDPIEHPETQLVNIYKEIFS